MSFGICSMLVARNTVRNNNFFHAMSQDAAATLVKDIMLPALSYDEEQLKEDEAHLEDQAIMLTQHESRYVPEEKETWEYTESTKAYLNKLAKQEKRAKALLTKPVKVEVGKVNLAKLTEEELKKELGKLALLKQQKEQEALRLRDEETKRLEREQRTKLEAEAKAKQAEIDRKKTEEKKAKELKALNKQREDARKASELTARLIKQQQQRDAMFAKQEAARKAADTRKNNLIGSIQEMYKALGL